MMRTSLIVSAATYIFVLNFLMVLSSWAQPFQWPPLPKTGFISGRVATTSDIAAKNAVFVAEEGGVPIGKPLGITIPQYAVYLDQETGKKVPVLVIQAEEARGKKLIGARSILDGAELVALLWEFELLGTNVPK